MNKWLIPILLFASCTSEPTPYQQAMYDLNRVNIEAVEQNFSLRCEATGGGSKDGVKWLTYGFKTKKLLPLSEARKLILAVTDLLVRTSEDYENHFDYFSSKGLSDKNFEVGISSDPARDYTHPDHIAYVFLINGNIHYTKALDPNGPLETVYEESFEEAQKIVQG